MGKTEKDGAGFRWVWEDRDHYQILEIPRDASQDEVKRAYHLQQKVWNPTNAPSTITAEVTRRSRRIIEAYDKLKDAAKRRKYDLIFLPEPESDESFEAGDQRNPRVWKRMASWMKDEDLGTPFHRTMVFQAGDLIERRRQPSEKQLKWMREGWSIAMDAGFDPDEEPDDE